MSIYYDEKTKKFYCQFRYKDWQGNTKATTKRGFRTKREAKEYETSFRLKSSGDINMPFSSLADEFIEHIKTVRKKSTYNGYKCVVNKHIKPFFGKMSLSKITSNHIRKWHSTLITDEYSEATLRYINVIAKDIFCYAVKYYGLKTNPIANIDAIGQQTKKIIILEPDEFNAIISLAPHDYVTTALKTLYFTGLRIGELLALTPDDITGCTISVTKTLYRDEITSPKSKSSIRTVTIPDELAKEIALIPKSVTGFLFHARYANCYYRRLKKLLDEAGIKKKVTLHSLRHSHASFLLHSGIPITAISKRLGHANSSITLSFYAHAFDNDDNVIKDILDNTFKMSSNK